MGKRQRVAGGQSDVMSKYECEGQMNIFDFIEKPKEKATWTKQCESCGHNDGGFCKYDHYKNNDYCKQGDKWTPKNAPICEHSKHTCNKKELWKVADTLDEIMCPHVCCRFCNTRLCGARCNGSKEPEKLDPDFPIKDKEGWRSFSDKPETFLDYEELELQVLGKYRMNNKDCWSQCPARFDGSRIIPLEVPFDIPRPDWKYWRVRPDKGISHDRYGREYKAPTWMDAKRCETCKFWELLPVADQPPSGWGVMGQCNCYHEPEMMKNGYLKTSKTSCCMDYKEKSNEQKTVGETL